MFCKRCGKELNDSAKFCPSCGAAQNESTHFGFSGQAQINNGAYNQSNSSKSTVKSVGKALIIIGIIFTVLTILFIATEGEILGYDSWSYEYTSGKSTRTLLIIISVVSLVIGIYMRKSSKFKK